MEKNDHIWNFSRIGGVFRVNLESGDDLIRLDTLDQKLWTALSCPVNGLEIDSQTLQLIDKDNDGKIRVPEVIEAVKWVISVIKYPNDLIQRRKSLPLSAIKEEDSTGKILLESAKQILTNLGKPDATELTAEDTSNTVAIFADTVFNGDGIITEFSTEDNELKELIRSIITCAGQVSDRSGKEGISEEQLNSFASMCESYSNWHKKAEDNKELILPLGDGTEEAFVLFTALKSKIDDYFLRCQLAGFNPQSAETLNTLSSRIESINNKDLPECIKEIEGFPIAQTGANQPLSFQAPVNPAWKDNLMKFKKIIDTFSGKDAETLTEDEWKTISEKFNAYSTWKSEKEGESVEILGLELVRAFLESGKKEQILSLINQDKALEEQASNIILVDKLVRYYCNIYTLLNNFVNFSDFYSPKSKGIFQAGSLYFDQRCCDLCIKVSDMAKHSTMAGTSGICLVYLNCTSKVKNENMTIVAAFTDGHTDDLQLGRNAVFYDNNGLDWDATIVKIIDNPISIRQAFWSPYRKMSNMISKQIEKWASSQEDKITAATSSGIGKASEKTLKPAPDSANEAAKPAPFDIAKFAGIFAAIGLAFGAIGSALTSIVGGFLALTWWKMPLALLGIILIISGPSMILAWLKLRKRNLAPVLDANGWAINAKATIDIAFGTTLTHLAKIPKITRLNKRK